MSVCSDRISCCPRLLDVLSSPWAVGFFGGNTGKAHSVDRAAFPLVGHPPISAPILPHSQLRGKGFKRLFNAFSKWRASKITAEMTVKARRESNSRACRDCLEES